MNRSRKKEIEPLALIGQEAVALFKAYIELKRLIRTYLKLKKGDV